MRWCLDLFSVATDFLAAPHLVGVVQTRPFLNAQLTAPGSLRRPCSQEPVNVGLLSQICGVGATAMYFGSCPG